MGIETLSSFITWGLQSRGVALHINKPFPDYSEFAVDTETDEKDNPFSLALCGDPDNVYVYFDLNDKKDFLRDLATRKIYAHNAKSDVSWLERFGFTMKNMAYDTMLAAYVLNSAEESFGLKALAKKYLNLEWPSYKDICRKDEFKAVACEKNPSLLIRKVKTYKTKPSVVMTKFPKHIPLYQYPHELIAEYTGMDVYACFMLKKHQEERTSDVQRAFMHKIEFPTSEILYHMEKKGIKMNLSKLIETHKKFLRKMYRAKRLFANFVGTDVLISSPSQVLKALKARMKLKIADTNENTLASMRHNRVIKLLLAYRGFSKICNTYTKPLYKKAAASLDNRVHCEFVQQTLTGRLSCRNPNLENQPPELLSCFEAEKGNVFIDADFSQIELRVPAHFSNDPIMVEGFKNPKEKFHAITAKALGVSYKTGKTINFLLTNGGGVERLAAVAGISIQEAQAAFDAHHKEFKGYWDWVKREQRLGRQLQGVTTLYGRFIPLPDVNSPNPKLRAYTERQIISGKVQGSASDVMKVAMINLYKKHGIVGVNLVHDEGLFEVPINKLTEVEQIVKEAMENSTKIRVPIVAEVGHGQTWQEAKGK